MYSLICTVCTVSCEITWKKNNHLEDEMKIQIRIPVWPCRIRDLDKFLLSYDIYIRAQLFKANDIVS